MIRKVRFYTYALFGVVAVLSVSGAAQTDTRNVMTPYPQHRKVDDAARKKKDRALRAAHARKDAAQDAKEHAQKARWAEIRRHRRIQKAEKLRRMHEETLRKHAAEDAKKRVDALKRKQRLAEIERKRVAERAKTHRR